MLCERLGGFDPGVSTRQAADDEQVGYYSGSSAELEQILRAGNGARSAEERHFHVDRCDNRSSPSKLEHIG